MSILSRAKTRGQERGLTLVELVMFIVIVSIAVVAVLQVMSNTTRRSVDPQLRKQALAIAEALLEEVQLMPLTACDPDGFDADAGTCVQPDGMGPEAAYASQPQPEARGSATAPFDNVNDYHGFTLAGGASDLGNSANVVVPAGYTARVAVAQDGAFGLVGAPLPANDALRITVTVSYGNDTLVVEGYRTRYAPLATP